MPESKQTDSKEAYQDDLRNLQKVFENRIVIKKEDLKAVYRKGNLADSKPRRIVIKFSSFEKKLEILRLRNLIFKTDENEVIKISLAPERTYKEQLEHQKLVLELKERRNSGEENLLIRNGKIVKYTPFRGDPQSYWG